MQRRIPWNLMSVGLCYSILGGLFGFASAPLWLWALALTLALSGAWGSLSGVEVLAGTGDIGTTRVLILALTGTLAWALTMTFEFSTMTAWSWGLVLALSLALVVTWSWSWAGAGGKLLESFNKLQTFLILVGTSAAGLGLGWTIAFAVRSNSFHMFGML
jgi:hypothetical protein